MILRPTELDGTFVIELEPIEDERGFFARAWCREEFEEHGLETEIEQCNVAFNRRSGTLRGLHFQRPPHAETKIVRCTSGALYDVVVDLRSGSPTYLQWIAVTLTAENRLALYIPAGLAHGYQTLRDDTEASYLHSTRYAPDSAAGVLWNDPAFVIEWPEADDRVISERDRLWPAYDPARPEF
jgi:dTDP-4-dehydrorhamnose 3,5-epimerase